MQTKTIRAENLTVNDTIVAKLAGIGQAALEVTWPVRSVVVGSKQVRVSVPNQDDLTYRRNEPIQVAA